MTDLQRSLHSLSGTLFQKRPSHTYWDHILCWEFFLHTIRKVRKPKSEVLKSLNGSGDGPFSEDSGGSHSGVLLAWKADKLKLNPAVIAVAFPRLSWSCFAFAFWLNKATFYWALCFFWKSLDLLSIFWSCSLVSPVLFSGISWPFDTQGP